MNTLNDGDLLDQFEQCVLPMDQWTHAAHLRACRAAQDRLGAEAALVFMRIAIRRYNEHTGTPNTASSGYHETLTRYYAQAIRTLGLMPIEDVLAHPLCSREAPLRHWSRERLFSPAARRGWVEPDLTSITWWPWRSEAAGSGGWSY